MIRKEAIFGNSRQLPGETEDIHENSFRICGVLVLFEPCISRVPVRDSPLLQFDLNQGFNFTVRNKIK
jgi:hypothetical protein